MENKIVSSLILTDEYSKSIFEKWNAVTEEDDYAFTYPVKGTASSEEFYGRLFKSVELVFYLISISVYADNFSLIASKIITGDVDLPKGYDPFHPIEQSPGKFRKKMMSVSSDLFEMVLSRICDNFTSYLSDVIREALRAKPDAVRSKESITIDIALEFDNVDDLREYIIDKKVNELAYMGFDKLSEWMSDRLGIGSLSKLPSFGAVSHLIEIRNCIIHNRGRASRKYLSAKNSNKSIVLGSKMPVKIEEIIVCGKATSDIVDWIDAAAIKKFNLKHIKIREKIAEEAKAAAKAKCDQP